MAAFVNFNVKVPVWLDKFCTWPLMQYRRRKYGYPFRRIYLGEERFTIVEPPDFYMLNKYNWHLIGENGKFYAVRSAIIDPSRTTILRMNRVIMNPSPGDLVDHHNGDSLDNRRDNLRIANHSQNASNRRKRKNASSRFNGVSIEKRVNKWQVRICHQGKKMFLGYFDNEIDAARAYDLAAIKYHGEFARLNFPREDYIDK